MSKYTLNYLRDHSRVDASRSLPWTARALGLNTLDDATADRTADGEQWLFDGPVPMAAVRGLLDSFSVDERPVYGQRAYRAGDELIDGYVVVGDMTFVPSISGRKIIADSASDRDHFVPKDGYQIHQHTDTLLDRTARIVGHGLAVSSVVVLANGAEAVVGVSTANLETTPEGVSFYSVLYAAGSHNGTLSTTTCGATIMPVCDNTRDFGLMQGKANGTMRKARHTKYSDAKLAEQESDAAAALGLLTERDESFAAMVAEWCAVEMTPAQDAEWTRVISGIADLSDDSAKAAVTRANNNADRLIALRNDARVSPWAGTGFGALQLASTFDQWERGTRGETDVFSRIVRETVTGTTAKREADRAEQLRKVLAG